jgi:hypothetical protein
MLCPSDGIGGLAEVDIDDASWLPIKLKKAIHELID